MSWDEEIDELRRRQALALAMGGPEKVARQHHFNKLTIRERVAQSRIRTPFTRSACWPVSVNTTHTENLQAFTPSNFVFGTAEVDGRPVVLSGDDFTVRGGSADASIAGKRTQAEGLALELKLPHVRLVDGMGGGGSVKTIERAGRTYIPELRGWETVVRHLGVAPSVSLALGSVAGIGAARVSTSHYSVIVKDSAQMMIAGPALVDWASLGDVSKEELGASRIHTRNGAIDDEVTTEARGLRSRPSFPLLPAKLDGRTAPRRAQRRSDRPSRSGPQWHRAERSAQGVPHAHASSMLCWIQTPSSRSVATGANPSSPVWDASMACRWLCLPRIRWSTAAPGQQTRAASSSG